VNEKEKDIEPEEQLEENEEENQEECIAKPDYGEMLFLRRVLSN